MKSAIAVHNKLITRIFLLWTMTWIVLLLAGCTATWTQEAINIITLLGPAISSALAILSAFGLGLSPNVATAVSQWSTSAISGLQQVKTLIEQYDAAQATAQPGILVEIQNALAAIVSNLSTILPTIKVTDPSTQAKILAVIEAVQSELAALVNLVPAIQGKVTAHEDLKKLVAAVKSPKEFKHEFNAAVDAFGPDAAQYKLD